jgi:hypothetical protein
MRLVLLANIDILEIDSKESLWALVVKKEGKGVAG